MTRNSQFSETETVQTVLDAVRALLPPRWNIEAEPDNGEARTAPRAQRADAMVRLQAPDGTRATLVIEVKRTVAAKDVPRLVNRVRRLGDGTPFVVARYLGPRTRELLEQEGAGYADTTGNLRLALDRPAVLLARTGATRDPSPPVRPLQSLKGPAAGRVVRALCEFWPPFGIRELAQRSRTAPATVARVVGLLDREAVLVRDPRGPVRKVDWKAVLERWIQDYGVTKSNLVQSFLAPRGLGDLRKRLAAGSLPFAVTGALAASELAPIAPAKLATVYVRSLSDATMKQLDLRPAETAGNVLLAEPYDEVVFERTWKRGGLTFAAVPQVAVDLLTGSGREPASGKALLSWMEANEDEWRL